MSNAAPGPNVPAPRELLQRYFLALRIDNWSPSTIDRRNHSLGQFVKWCGDRDINLLEQLTAADLEAYRHHLYHHKNRRTGKPIRFATQASYLSAIRHWMAWLVDEGYLATNPALKLRLPKAEHRLPAGYLTHTEVETLLNSVELTTLEGLRDRAILETLYSTAMRRGELIALRLEDIDRERRLLRLVQAKNRKYRLVPIGPRALTWLEKYLGDVRPHFVDQPNDWVFLSSRGRPLHAGQLSITIRGYLTAIGIERRGSCHMLRHTAATLMMERGADLRSLQVCAS